MLTAQQERRVLLELAGLQVRLALVLREPLAPLELGPLGPLEQLVQE